MHKTAVIHFSVLLVFACALSARAAKKAPVFKLHQLSTDNAVLQRDTAKHPFKGFAPAGSEVEVAFRGSSERVKADENGEWCAYLPTGAAGSGFELKAVSGDKTLTATNIAVGEVWVVSGQSNAEFAVRRFRSRAPEWVKDADYPLIRFQTQTWQPPHMRKDDKWRVLDAKSAMSFSATGFFFAKQLHKDLGVPVGIVVAARSGSEIKTWIPEKYLETIPHARKTLIEPYEKAKREYPEKYKVYSTEAKRRKTLPEEEAAKLPKLKSPWRPYKLYSGNFKECVSRLEGLPVKGLIWYQGEADAMFARGYDYRYYLEALVLSYREHFANEMPFLVVQLPYYGNHPIWADLRDSQNYIADRMKDVHVVPILDIGDLKDIHPGKKPELGARLAAVAGNAAYGKNAVVTGPVYESMKADGGRIVVSFKPGSIGGGLVAKDGEALRGFTIAGKDGAFKPAQAVIEGDRIVVSSENVKAPEHVRYAWMPPKDGVNFFNKKGFPAGPFRTDTFKLLTEKSR